MFLAGAIPSAGSVTRLVPEPSLLGVLIAGAYTQMDAVERRFGKLINQQTGNVEDARVKIWSAAQNVPNNST